MPYMEYSMTKGVCVENMPRSGEIPSLFRQSLATGLLSPGSGGLCVVTLALA
jgi:hypothetical protein